MKLDFRPEAVQVDHTGKDFGLLEIRQYAGHFGDRSYWICVCECGKAVEARFDDLRRGNVKSCGCQQNLKGPLNNTWAGYGEISGNLYAKIRRDAARRSIAFDVEIAELWELFLKQGRLCALTGWPIWFSPVSDAKRDVERTASLDRIDSRGCYEIKNLRWVHKRCNQLKMSFSDKELLELVGAIAKHKKLKVK